MMALAPPRILVLKTGTTHPGTRRRFGDFDRWFLDALRGVDACFEVHDTLGDPPPDLRDYDGVLITGSPASVYDQSARLDALEEALRQAVQHQETPVLAVCFGAQALASALGGRVSKNPLGWEIGTIRIEMTEAGRHDELLGGDAGERRFQATHQDVIDALPGEAVVLAGNGMSPVQAFRVGPRVWGVQFHPEVSPAILESLIRSRRVLLEKQPAASAIGLTRYQAAVEGLRPTPAGRSLLLRFLEACGAPRRQERDQERPGA
jgi:GMP synthase (glutamine-hydrolysing)